MKPYVALFICLFSVDRCGAATRAQGTACTARPHRPLQAPPAPPAPPVDPEQGGQPINIRLDVSVIDQTARGSSAQVAHGHAGRSGDGSNSRGIPGSFNRRRCEADDRRRAHSRLSDDPERKTRTHSWPLCRTSRTPHSLAEFVFVAARERQADGRAGDDGRRDEAEAVD